MDGEHQVKRGCIDHPKTLLLKERLDVHILTAAGILEALWHWTAQYAPAGDIGRYSNVQIAQGIRWTQQIDDAQDRQEAADLLITALSTPQENGAPLWLDPHDDHRLIVHDWYDHCEDAVHTYLFRNHLRFATGQIPRAARIPLKEREVHEQYYEPDPAPTEPKPKTKPPKARREAMQEWEAHFHEFWDAYPRKVKKKEAFTLWMKIAPPNDDTFAAIMAGLARAADSNQWKKNDGEFIPHPTTWLRNERWNDQPEGTTPAPDAMEHRDPTDDELRTAFEDDKDEEGN